METSELEMRRPSNNFANGVSSRLEMTEERVSEREDQSAGTLRPECPRETGGDNEPASWSGEGGAEALTFGSPQSQTGRGKTRVQGQYGKKCGLKRA